jgi:hypothetical protein
MPVDDYDSTANTAELPLLTGAQVRSDPIVFSGRARPVVLSEAELARLDEADDPSVERVPPGGQGLPPAQERSSSPASFLKHSGVVLVLALPAMFVVAFGIALAVRL